MKTLKYIYLLAIVMLTGACGGDFLETELIGKIPAEDALKSTNDMNMLLNSAYEVTANVMSGETQNHNELLGDNIYVVNNDDFMAIFNRSTDFFNGTLDDFYTDNYRTIYRANLVMENIGNVAGLSDADKSRIEGECKFLRALAHFQMIRLYAQPYGYTAGNTHLGIPLRTEANYDSKFRSTVQEGYDLIIADLTSAVELLPTSNNNYATSWAAKALLAKVYFQMNDFVNANAYAGDVIDNGGFSFDDNGLTTRYQEGELSSEWIFGFLSSDANDDNRFKELRDKYRTDTQDPPLRISQNFYNLVSERSSDKRLGWFEVKNEGEENEYVGLNRFNMEYANTVVLHLTEMMLIRAESLAEQGQNLATAVSYINQIRLRAGVSSLDAGSSAEQVKQAVRLERRIELMAEGDRAQEIKRIGAKGEQSFSRGADWNCPGMVLQFPNAELIPGFTRNEEGGCN